MNKQMARIKLNDWSEYDSEAGQIIFNIDKMSKEKMKFIQENTKDNTAIEEQIEIVSEIEKTQNSDDHSDIQFVRQLMEDSTEEEITEAEMNLKEFFAVVERIAKRLDYEEQQGNGTRTENSIEL